MVLQSRAFHYSRQFQCQQWQHHKYSQQSTLSYHIVQSYSNWYLSKKICHSKLSQYHLRTYGRNCSLKKIAIWKIPQEILRTGNFTTNCSCLILGQNCQSRQLNHHWRTIFFVNQFVNSQILFLNSIYRLDYGQSRTTRTEIEEIGCSFGENRRIGTDFQYT